jgi:hypothetical protein
MTTKKCILTDEFLSTDNDSKAHIIPSALGGNIKPKGILSVKANAILNVKFDNPLIKSLSPFMALLGAIPDRSTVQPTKMTDQYGEEYLVNFGEKLKPTKPKINKIQKSENETLYEIEARTIKEAKTLLGKIKKDHPEINIDIDSLAKDFKYKDSPINGMLNQRLSLGPNIFFPASFVMASIFAASKGMFTHPGFKEFVNNFDSSTLLDDDNLTSKKATIPSDTFYWIHSKEWFRVSAEISHILILFGDSQRKKSIFYVELFNLPGIAVILPYEGSSDAIYTHGIDVINGCDAEIILDEDAFRSLEWEPTHIWEIGKLDDFFSIARQKVERVIGIAQKRSEIHEINRLIKEKIGEIDDERTPTLEERKQIFKIITDFHTNKIIHSIKSKTHEGRELD